MISICAFLGSRTGNNPEIEMATVEMGKLMASHKMRLVYGGGRVGLMGILADTVLKNGGEVYGVIPTLLFSKEVAHTGLTKLYEVKTMHERKALMENLSEGFVTLPGGFGTMDEVCEIITWNQIGLHQKPVGFLNTGGFFDAFFEFAEKSAATGFIPSEHIDRIIKTDKPDLLLSEIKKQIRK